MDGSATWAAWWAVDKDGSPYWYAERPEPGKSVWWNRIGSERRRVQPIGRRCRLDMASADWRQTLRGEMATRTAERIPEHLIEQAKRRSGGAG